MYLGRGGERATSGGSDSAPQRRAGASPVVAARAVRTASPRLRVDNGYEGRVRRSGDTAQTTQHSGAVSALNRLGVLPIKQFQLLIQIRVGLPQLHRLLKKYLRRDREELRRTGRTISIDQIAVVPLRIPY